MIFKEKLTNKSIKYRKILIYVWMIVFFVFHVSNTWRLHNVRSMLIFLSILLFSAVLIGIIGKIISFFLSSFAKNERKNDKISVPFLLPFAFSWVFVIFFINIDNILNFEIDKTRYIWFSFIDITKSLAATSLFFISAYAAGKKILDFFKFDIFTRAENILVSLALGIGFLGYLFFFLSVLKLDYMWIAYSLILIISAIGRKDIKNILLALFRKKIEVVFKDNFLERWAKILLISILLMTFIYSLSDLAGAGWDTFHQYLTFPDAYQKNHGLVYFQFHPHWGFPQLSEMMFLGGMLLGGTKIPFLIGYFLIFFGFWGFARITVDKNGKYNIWPLAILVSVPFLLTFQSGYLKVEPLLFFYSVISFLILKRILLGIESRKLWILLAVFLSFLLAVKYTSIFIIFSMAISLWIFRKRFKCNWKIFFLMAIIIFIIFSPWLAKNYIYYKSPLYPLFSGNDYFSNNLNINCHSYFIDSCREDIFIMRKDNLFLENSQFFSNILVVLKILLFGDLFGNTNPGPFLIIFLPMIIWNYFFTKNYFARFLSFFSIIFLFLGLYFFSGQIWYFLPLVVSYTILCSYILGEESYFKERLFAKILILFWLLSIASIFIFNDSLYDKSKYIRGEKSLEETFASANGKNKKSDVYYLFKICNYINEKILAGNGRNSIIYSFTDTQGYFINDSYKNFIPDFYGYLFKCLSENGDAHNNMKKIGVNYIIFDSGSYLSCQEDEDRKNFFTCRAKHDFELFIKEHGELVIKEGNFELYYLK